MQAGFEHGLVALALGHAFWLASADGEFRLLVEPAAAESVREELARFDRESAGWPPRPPPVDRGERRADLLTPLLWGVGVAAAHRGQLAHGEWTDAGALVPAAVFERGEWWRPVTALFLHADLGHLVSNLLSGIFVFAAVLSAFGRGWGWLLVAAAAIAGNVAAALAHLGTDYRSIGASTAVFAALGLLTGRAVRRVWGHRSTSRWRPVFVPLAAGLAVLGLFGAGGVQIDVVAHTTGFAAGLALGFAAAPR